MFRVMGQLSDTLRDTLIEAARAYFAAAIPDDRYVAWLAEAGGAIVGGAGLQLRELLPRPAPGDARLVRGPPGLIMIVFTDRAWRLRCGGADCGAANRPTRCSTPGLRRSRSDRCAHARGSGPARSPP